MDALAQLNSALANRYQIEREIGAGGMATVYLARDVRHQRFVALKVLNPELGAVLGVERFLSEIRVTANLQHPNLLPLFDSGEADGLLFYVMPFVEGESLRHRLDREKQFPVDEAIRIASAIASALATAHERGVIHRDLKPENILLQAGQPVVADFGIALAVSNAGGTRITQTGLSLGTPQYMSPEQATGDRAIDARADIYSLGAILYEMLTGEPPHTGSTAQAVIARVLTEHPRSLRASRPSVPEHVELAVMRALEKLPADRWSSAKEFADALHDGTGVASSTGSRARAERDGTRANVFVAAWRRVNLLVLAFAGIAAFFAVRALRGNDDANRLPLLVASLAPPVGERFTDGAGFNLSPDGTRLAFAPRPRSGRDSIWIRHLDSLDGAPVRGTAGGSLPFWSPDGKTLGFFVDGQLKVIAATGGVAASLCAAPQPWGAAWGSSGIIVFAYGMPVQLARVSATGGACTHILTADGRVGRPSFLPDGRHIVFSTIMTTAIRVADIETGKETLVGATGLGVSFAPPNYIVYVNGAGTQAQRFDLRRFKALGEPARIAERVTEPGATRSYSVSEGVWVGQLAREDRSHVVWLDRVGRPLDSLSDPGGWSASLSRDGQRIAWGGFGMWMQDVSRRIETRLPIVAGVAERSAVQSPVWSPGDSLLAFTRFVTGSGGALQLFDLQKGSTRTLKAFPQGSIDPKDWSADGRYLLLIRGATDSTIHSEVWIYAFPDSSARKLFGATGDVTDARLSPDGRWVAYVSNETGSLEVYLRPFSGLGVPTRVSTNGASHVAWEADGSGLIYIDADGRFVAAPVQTSPSLRIGTPKLLQDAPTVGAAVVAILRLRDKQRIPVQLRGDPSPLLTVIYNWQAKLRHQ